MLKKTITFKDLDGQDVTEDFYFNLTKVEITEMELSYEDGLSAHLEKIVKTDSGAEIISTFKKIVLSAVGRRSEDGKRFIKSQEISDEFSQTEAYSDFFMELVTDAKAASEFVNAIVPQDLVQAHQLEETMNATPWITENREPTKQELMSMTTEQMREVMARKMQEPPSVTTE